MLLRQKILGVVMRPEQILHFNVSYIFFTFVFFTLNRYQIL